MLTSHQFRELLLARASDAGVTIPDSAVPRLEAYFQLLTVWNAKINLTALPLLHPTPEAFDRLFVEPIIAATHIDPGAATVIDIGSGGGSPAIPLTVLRPDLRLRMVESKSRKAVFLREAARAAGIADVEVFSSRLEELSKRNELSGAHDVVTVRAVRLDRPTLLAMISLLASGGQLLIFGSEPSSALVELGLHGTTHQLPNNGKLSVWTRNRPAQERLIPKNC